MNAFMVQTIFIWCYKMVHKGKNHVKYLSEDSRIFIYNLLNIYEIIV